MWFLKIRYKHKDCLYTDKIHSLGLGLSHFYLGQYVKGGFVYISAMQKISGEDKKIKSYMRYLTKISKIVKLETHGSVALILAKHKRDLKTYKSLYNPSFIYPTPATVDENGFEIIEIACWQKKPLQELYASLEADSVTVHLEMLAFCEKDSTDMYVARLLPDLPLKQREAFELASQLGYYSYPREIDLEKLAKMMKISKPTYREHLRRAEAKLLPLFGKDPSMRG